MIVWLENPKQWRYLRESNSYRGTQRSFKRGVKLPIANFYKLIGYELIGRAARSVFHHHIYWLKTYDSGCPRGYEVYDKDGEQPCEARSINELLKRGCSE